VSDTTSFLGGAALAGLAALIVLRGGVNFGSVTPGQSSTLLPMPPMAIPGMGTGTTGTTMPGMPSTGMTGLTLPTPGPIVATAPTSNGEKTYEDAKQRIELDQIKSQLEQQQSQIRSQQALIDALTAQTRTAGLNPANAVVPAMVPQMQNSQLQNGHDASFVSGLPWALGGVLLTFGGGIAVVGMFSMLSRQNGRPNRTVEYIHDDYPAYLPQRRRVQSLPPRRTVRRVDLEDDD
jgi:hypothetical protein